MSTNRPRSSAARANTLIFAIGAVLLALIVGLSYREWQRYARERADVTRLRAVLASGDDLIVSLLDAETGQRGFLLTGEDRYLEPYDRAIRTIPANLAILNGFQPEQVAPERRARLNSLVDLKLTELRRTIDLRRTQGSAPALAIVLSDEGKRAMDEIRAIWADIRVAQSSEMTAAQVQAESAARTAFLITIVGSLVLLGFFVAGNRAVHAITLARERALAEAQRIRDSLRTTLASIGDAVISTDEAGHIVFANKVAQSLLRASESEITGRHLDEVFRIVNEFTRAKVESPVTKVLREGTIVGLANHTILIAQDGTEVPIDDSAAPITSSDGSVQGTVLVFRDVTQRRRAEATGQLLSSIVMSSDDAILSKDLNGIVTSWNPAAERMFGYTAGEVVGRSVGVLYPPDRLPELPEILGRIAKGERVEHHETLRRTKSGALLHVSVTVSPVRDAEGRVTGASDILRDITAQVEARKELAEQREQLRVTLRSIGDAVMATDPEGRLTYLNPVAEQLTGWRAEEASGRPLEEVFRIVNEHSRRTVENPVAKVLREGKVVGLANHTVLLARDGREIPIDDSAAPILSDAGSIQGTVLVFRDITERRRAEAASQLLSSIVVSSDDAILSKDLNGTITSWNRAAERMFGYSAEEVIGRSISVLYPPDRLHEMPEILGRIAKGERVDHHQTLRRTKSGAIIHVSVTVSPVQDADGRIAGASKIVRDITAQVHAQNEIAEQRERLRVTLSSIGDAVLATDHQGRVSYLNPVAEQLTGWRTPEASGRPVEEVFRIVNEQSRQTAENPVAKVLREGGVVGLANHTVLLARDGRETPIDDSAAPIRNERGEMLGVVLVFRDITNRREAEKRSASQAAELSTLAEELRESNAALQRANEDLQQFAFAASHDLQEPLRMITTYAQLLIEGHRGQLGGEAELCVSFISRGTARMRELLSDLLAYTQLNDQQADEERVDLNTVFRKALENLTAAISETGAVVDCARLPSVRGQEAHFLQLFQNLLGNAIKYRGADTPKISVAAVKDGRTWKVSVTDNGIGIAPEYHDHVFGVFKRLHGKKIPGTGIGLAICQRVVERYGGRIWVESALGEGATFHFTLPAEEGAHA